MRKASIVEAVQRVSQITGIPLGDMIPHVIRVPPPLADMPFPDGSSGKYCRLGNVLVATEKSSEEHELGHALGEFFHHDVDFKKMKAGEVCTYRIAEECLCAVNDDDNDYVFTSKKHLAARADSVILSKKTFFGWACISAAFAFVSGFADEILEGLGLKSLGTLPVIFSGLALLSLFQFRIRDALVKKKIERDTQQLVKSRKNMDYVLENFGVDGYLALVIGNSYPTECKKTVGRWARGGLLEKGKGFTKKGEEYVFSYRQGILEYLKSADKHFNSEQVCLTCMMLSSFKDAICQITGE